MHKEKESAKPLIIQIIVAIGDQFVKIFKVFKASFFKVKMAAFVAIVGMLTGWGTLYFHGDIVSGESTWKMIQDAASDVMAFAVLPSLIILVYMDLRHIAQKDKADRDWQINKKKYGIE